MTSHSCRRSSRCASSWRVRGGSRAEGQAGRSPVAQTSSLAQKAAKRSSSAQGNIALPKPKISAEAEKLAKKAEALLEAGDGRGCITLAMKACQIGESPRAHRMLARYFVANDKSERAVDHYDRACACAPEDWELRVEATEAVMAEDAHRGAGLPPTLAKRVERYARECVALLEATRRDAKVIATELKVRTLWSRVLRALGDGANADLVSDAIVTLARDHLAAPTAALPRLGVGALADLPTCLLGRSVRVDRISLYPLAFRICGLLSDSECAHIAKLAGPHLESSGVAVPGGGQAQGYRTSSTAWLPTIRDSILQRLTERIASLMGLPAAALLDGEAEDAGKIQVVHYRPGQQYGVHHDCNGVIRRFATCLYYLADVESGGETHFPAASDDPDEWRHLRTSDAAIDEFISPEHKMTFRQIDTPQAQMRAKAEGAPPKAEKRTGVLVRPRKGDALLWYNYDASGCPDPRAVHSALPVGEGMTKLAANHWISFTPLELLRREQHR